MEMSQEDIGYTMAKLSNPCDLLCLDTAEEVSIYESGGVLQRFAQNVLKGNTPENLIKISNLNLD